MAAYHYMVSDMSFAVRALSPDRELRGCVRRNEIPSPEIIPEYVYREKYTVQPALPFSMGVRLMSLQLRGVIEESLGPEDAIDWVSCTVLDDDAEIPHAIPIVRSRPPALHREFTSYDQNGRVIRSVLEAASLAGLHVVAVPGEVNGLVVAEDIRKRIQNQGLVGVDWMAARVA